MPDAPTRAGKPIVLVGLMGAGKSTIGRRLAERLGLSFADSDAEVEAEAGLTIAALFERHGEARFRERERRAIARLVERPPGVIATGGGAFADPATRALILERCIAIWLDAEPAVLAERIGRSEHRPLLGSGDRLAALRALAEARDSAYAEAHFRVRSDEAAVETIVAALG